MSEGVPIAIGIDVGGSGIKGAAVDLSTGRLASNRHRILTPQPSTPRACLEVIARIVRAIWHELPEARTAPIGVGVPSVVIDGVTKSAANIDLGWVGFDGEHQLERILGRPVRLVNDADAAGLAEMRFGAGRGKPGTVLVLTLGTGLGSGFFVDGRLVPNTELGHMEIRGRDAERRSAAAARVRRALSWKAWAEDLDEHLNAIHKLFWPSLLILGGGVSKNADRFIPRLTVPTKVVAATLKNEAGIVGAALFASETTGVGQAWVPVAEPEPGSEAAGGGGTAEGADTTADDEVAATAADTSLDAALSEGAEPVPTDDGGKALVAADAIGNGAEGADDAFAEPSVTVPPSWTTTDGAAGGNAQSYEVAPETMAAPTAAPEESEPPGVTQAEQEPGGAEAGPEAGAAEGEPAG